MGTQRSRTDSGRRYTAGSDRRRRARVLAMVMAATIALAAGATAPAYAAAPPIRHVWVINLENNQVCMNPAFQPVAAARGGAGCPLQLAPYLTSVLPSEATMVENYFGI